MFAANSPRMTSLDDLRQQIDAVDEELVRLLNERAQLSLDVGRRKAASPEARYFAPERERDMLDRLVAQHAAGPLPKEALLAIYREIISASIALQKPITIAFWGPPGTFTEMAARRRFGSSAGYFACATIPDVFGEVERGRADYGVVPVENSTEGVVNYTLDMFHSTSLKVCAEVYVDIVQNLLTHAPDLKSVKRLYSAPIVIAQCRHWLDTHLAHAETIEVQPTGRRQTRKGRRLPRSGRRKCTASRCCLRRLKTARTTARGFWWWATMSRRRRAGTRPACCLR